LKIVTWNCNGSFRTKFGAISKEDADVYIIQECEDPERVLKRSKEYDSFALGHRWRGENKNKGLGIFVRNGLSIELLDFDHTWRGRNLNWFLPVTLPNEQKLLAVCNHRGESDEYRYIGQFWCMMQSNKDQLSDTIIAGDFNSNTIWDYKRNECTHSNCVRQLKEMGIESLYHMRQGIEQGKEEQSTFFLQKNEKKNYHIDYIFSPQNLAKNTKTFKIGDFEQWKEFSDHVPVVWEYLEKSET